MVSATAARRAEEPRRASNALMPDPLGPIFPPPTPEGLGVGDVSRKVKRAEQLLQSLGFSTGTVDAKFSERTERALKKFQQSVGLPETGRLDDATFAKLKGARERQRDHPDALARGQAGRDVKRMEERLKKLGYDTGRVDGVFDAKTAKAVRGFKADEDIGGPQEMAGKGMRRELRHDANALSHGPFRARRKETADNARLDARVAERAAQGFGVGSEGKAVEVVQRHLKAAGYDPSRVDGTFDERTAGALRAYQRREKIPVTGEVDATTWRHLKGATIEADGAADPKQRIGERSGAVRETEKLLKKLGLNPGDVDGVYSKRTERAVDRFRARHDMNEGDGVGPATLKALKKAAKNTIVKPIGTNPGTISEFGVPDAEGAPANNGTRYHAGKDWFGPGGARVGSPVNGKVVEVSPSRGNSGQIFGGVVKVQDDKGRVWVFRHVDPKGVHVGERVKAGEKIATLTNWADGPSHAHIEVWKSLRGGYDYENMIDPMKFFRRFA